MMRNIIYMKRLKPLYSPVLPQDHRPMKYDHPQQIPEPPSVGLAAKSTRRKSVKRKTLLCILELEGNGKSENRYFFK